MQTIQGRTTTDIYLFHNNLIENLAGYISDGRKIFSDENLNEHLMQLLNFSELANVKVSSQGGGDTPYIGHTGMCGLYGWVFSRRMIYVDMGIFWNLKIWV